MPRRHSRQTVYRVEGNYYSMVGPQPDRLRLDSKLRVACDQIDHYQGGHGRGFVLDAMWRVDEDRLATEAEIKQLASQDVPGNPLRDFGQFRVVTLAMCGGELLAYRPKYALYYLWWVRYAVLK